MKFTVVAAVVASLLPNSIGTPIETRGPTVGDVTFYKDSFKTDCLTSPEDSEYGVKVSLNVFNSFPAVPVKFTEENPICEEQIKVFIPSTGKTIIAPVVGAWVGCRDNDLDLGLKPFSDLGLEQSQGRISGAEWEFVGIKPNETQSGVTPTESGVPSPCKDAYNACRKGPANTLDPLLPFRCYVDYVACYGAEK